MAAHPLEELEEELEEEEEVEGEMGKGLVDELSELCESDACLAMVPSTRSPSSSSTSGWGSSDGD